VRNTRRFPSGTAWSAAACRRRGGGGFLLTSFSEKKSLSKNKNHWNRRGKHIALSSVPNGIPSRNYQQLLVMNLVFGLNFVHFDNAFFFR
jgi:hypothetical protein